LISLTFTLLFYRANILVVLLLSQDNWFELSIHQESNIHLNSYLRGIRITRTNSEPFMGIRLYFLVMRLVLFMCSYLCVELLLISF